LTGAAGNIGSHISRYLLREGARVVMTGRNEQKLNDFARTLVGEGFSADHMFTAVADSADADACRDLCRRATEHFGRLDVLVNNAGGPGPKRTLESVPFTEDDCRITGDSETMLDAANNLLAGPWNMVRAAVPHMTPGSSIINVSTIFSRTPYYGRIPYVVPKSGLNALSLGLARELGQSNRGIRVNTVYPGPIESERIDNVFKAMDELQGTEPGTTSQQFLDLMILRRQKEEADEAIFRYPTPQDVAATVTWLSSSESAAFSGHSFEVTNGMQVLAQSRSKLVSWPDKRLVDLRDRVVLILGGRDIGEAMEFADRHRGHDAQVVLAFRSLEVLEKTRAKLRSQNVSNLPVLHLDPLRRDTVERSLQYVADNYGRLDGVVVLPVNPNGVHGYALSTASDLDVDTFIRDEVVAPVAFASSLAKLLHHWSGLREAPAITFVTNPDDEHHNRLNDVNRAAVEELIRVWRHEESLAVRRSDRPWGCLPNQIVRFNNKEPDNLSFSAAWSATLTNRVRKMDAINLWVPKQIKRATGKSSMPLAIQRVLPGLHSGQTAVVTGGSVGIGLQLGRFLALAGVRVLLSARDPKKLEVARASIVEELEQIGYPEPENRVHVLADVDVGNEASLTRLFEHSIELFGNVDILINNAGISGAEEMVVDMTLESWNRTMDANLISNYSLIRKFAPLMKAHGRGKILNVSSYFGGEKYLAVAYPNRADYSVSKAGQRVLAEILSRHLGPEIQINALAPGPVDGLRLRGTGGQPGLFERRGRLIMANKRLNLIHAKVLDAVREGAQPSDFLDRLAANQMEELRKWSAAPSALVELFRAIDKGKPTAVSTHFLSSRQIAERLMERLQSGGVVTEDAASAFLDRFTPAPEPFFDMADVQREAEKVEAGIIDRLHLHKMPTDEQVALSTVFYLADEIVSGETFHPSGGLKFERSVTEGELMVRPGRESLSQLEGKNVVIVGEYMQEEILRLVRAYSDLRVGQIALITETRETADELERRAVAGDGVKLAVRAVGNDLEGGLRDVRAEMGRVDVVVSTAFRRLPMNALTAEPGQSWDRVLSHEDFGIVVRDHLTHHFRVARKAALWDRCQMVLVTPETSRASSREEFALALFVKNSLHAFTVTLGVEGERLATTPAVNQVQLTRRSRVEEPSNDKELEEEMSRYVDAVLLCSIGAPAPDESRYLSRIYRGNAVTV
jgi:malonyl-CoA reductase/3-hydroxypropionate dehydrogenase (NADP+)